MNRNEFIALAGACAVKDMEASGVLASVSIAQAILESGYGSTSLATKAHNYFGMKANLSSNSWVSVWDGKSIYTKETKEFVNGEYITITANFRKYPDMETSFRDHSCYLVGSKKGSSKRYEGLVGEKDYRKAIQIIKDGGYATDPTYVDKVCSIIEQYNLIQYDIIPEKEVESKMGIEIIRKIATQNPCYKSGRTIVPKGGMLHSVGCPQPDPLVFVKTWQKPDAKVLVHAVVGKDKVVYQTLDWNRRAWHCSSGSKGSGNNTLISIEMTEPATIKYTGGSSWIETGNGANTKSHVLATYANAVEFFAFICKKYGFNPLDSDVLMSHSEGHSKGIASAHGDVEHIWNKFGLSMNQFRKDVYKAMNNETVSTVPTKPINTEKDDTSNQTTKTLNGTLTVTYSGSDSINLRVAPSITSKVSDIAYSKDNKTYKVVGISSDEKWYKLDSGLYITAIPEYVKFTATKEQKESTANTGYYRVRRIWADASSQIGAFKDKDNAIELCKNNVGYKVFDNDGTEVYPLFSAKVPFSFKVNIKDLRIRKGAGTTYAYHKNLDNSPKVTGLGIFTIVETSEGAGATKWGLLKSYSKNRDGWIALDSEYGDIL